MTTRAPSAAAIEAAYREGRNHGGSFREEHGDLIHICACGVTFRDDGVSRRDGDDLWQLHAMEMELRAAYAVDFPIGTAPEARPTWRVVYDEHGVPWLWRGDGGPLGTEWTTVGPVVVHGSAATADPRLVRQRAADFVRAVPGTIGEQVALDYLREALATAATPNELSACRELVGGGLTVALLEEMDHDLVERLLRTAGRLPTRAEIVAWLLPRLAAPKEGKS